MFIRSTRIALLFGISGAFLGYISQLTLLNNDIFHALSYCREALERGSFPLVDVYAFTPTIAPVVHHEWGTGAIVYLVTVTIGLGAPGLILLKYLLTTGYRGGSLRLRATARGEHGWDCGVGAFGLSSGLGRLRHDACAAVYAVLFDTLASVAGARPTWEALVDRSLAAILRHLAQCPWRCGGGGRRSISLYSRAVRDDLVHRREFPGRRKACQPSRVSNRAYRALPLAQPIWNGLCHLPVARVAA